MSEEEKNDGHPTDGMSWWEKKRWAARQVRQRKVEEILAAQAAGDEERVAELEDELNRTKQERSELKEKARQMRAEVQAHLPALGVKRWNLDDPEARAWIDGGRAAREKPQMKWNMFAGQMVRLVNECEAWNEAYMVKRLPKGSIGILIDPPTGDRVAVMFGADLYHVPCKRIRPVREGDE